MMFQESTRKNRHLKEVENNTVHEKNEISSLNKHILYLREKLVQS